MIQFNLLPDVKVQFIKAQRLKRLMIAVSIIISAAVLVIFVLLLLFVDVAQKKHLDDISNNIQTDTTKLTGNANLGKILTIQDQLQTLPALESQTPVASRLFGYMTQITPSQASISSLSVSYTANTFTISGSADSLATVDQFADTLKFTTYTSGNSSGLAFSSVVLSSFSYDTTNANGFPASYTFSLDFNPLIFSNASSVTLTVPQITTTRSVIAQPTDLFQKSTTPTTTQGSQ